MKKIKEKFTLTKLVVLGVIAFLTGCAGGAAKMQEISDDQVSGRPDAGMAQIVFMRPSTFGFINKSSVFEIVNNEPELVGIVGSKKKVSYQVAPGEHLFMVVGESADFMSANVDPDRTYHALVTPRVGAFTARFSLRPVTQDDRSNGKFDDWDSASSWVAKSAGSDAWAIKNISSIKKKQNKYFPKWQEKGRENQPRLNFEDGI